MILGIHTAIEKLSLALVHSKKLRDQKIFEGPTVLAEDLLVWIEELLKSNQLTPHEIKAMGICVGPGAFTGLRLAMVTAKTLAYALKIPLYGFDLFAGLGEQLKRNGHWGSTLAVFHACRQESNIAQIQVSKDQEKISYNLELAVDEKRLWQKLPSADFYVGDFPKEIQLNRLDLFPQAQDMAFLAEQSFLSGHPSQLEALEIMYSHAPHVRLSNKPELLRLREAS